MQPDPRHTPNPETEKTAARLVSKARTDLLLSQPFFGSLALKLKPVVDWTERTMAVDGTHLFYNPEFTVSLPFKELVGVVAHEVMHCALKHHVRRQNRDGDTWNEAGDYAINSILTKSGFELPDGALLNSAYDDLGAEAIYTKLYRAPKDNSGASKPQAGGAGGPGTSGGQQGGPQGQNQGQGGQGQGQNPGQGTGTGGATGPGEGAGAGGAGNDATGRVKDAPDLRNGAATATEEEIKWDTAVAQAVAAAKAAGKLPGSLAEFVEAMQAPKVDWREVLRDFCTSFSKNDYSWMIPNRRFVARRVYLPSARSERTGPVAIVVDTSGSVSTKELEAFRSEIASVLGEVRPEAVRVIHCDTRVTDDRAFDPDFDDIEMSTEFKGRGGTDMTPAFERIIESGEDFECVICMTDLEFYRWPADPGVPVLWVSTGAKDAPFGTVLPLDLS